MDPTINILFCGIGGQKVLKTSEVCGVAAIASGYHVRKSETHGMAQRGGSVESHLRFGAIVHSPLIMPGNADFLVCFHAGEAKRLGNFLKPQGIDFSQYLKYADDLSGPCDSNSLFLGILAAKLSIPVKHWHTALESVMTKNIDENRETFQRGFQIGKNLF